MNSNKKKIKLWHALLLLLLCVFEIFIVGGLLVNVFGLYGTLISEINLLILAVGVVFCVRADFSEVFPIHKISIAGAIGTFLLWIGYFLIVIILDLVIMVFYPNEMSAVSEGLGNAFTSVAFVVSFLIVSISPAICEEAVFRGVILHGLNPEKNKWMAIIISAVLFGACHGSIWRFLPTTCAGLALGYIVVETKNMSYAALFHCINNLIPLLTLFFPMNHDESAIIEMATPDVIFMGVGLYCMIGAIIPMCLYIGNYLIHYKQPGYRTTIFPKDKPWTIGALIISSSAFFVIGFLIVIAMIVYQIQLL